MPDGTPVPDSKVLDTQEEFENQSQRNANEQSDSQTAWEVNRKRTYDAYQHPDLAGIQQNQRFIEQSSANLQAQLAAINNVSLQALQNAVKVSDKIHIDAANDVIAERAASRKVADMAADGMWTDQMNPVTRGAGDVLTGQAPVNSQLATTASLDTVYTNITAQNGQLIGAFISMMDNLTNSNAAQAALIAQLVANSGNAGAATASAPKA